MKKVLSMIAAVMALAAFPAAQASDPYVGVAAGIWLPDTTASDIKIEMDNGVAGELRAGWPLGDAFALEGAVGGFQAEGDQPPVDVTETTLHSVAAWYVMASARASMPVGDGAWRLSASAGVGYYRADLHAKQPPSQQVRATESDTGFHLGVAVHYALGEHAGVALEYRQVRVSPGDVDVDGAAALLVADYRY